MVDAIELQEVLPNFPCGPSVTARPLGEGNINTTYLVLAEPAPFVLQRLNSTVFPDPAAVIANYGQIHKHYKKLSHAERATFLLAAPVYTKKNDISVVDGLGDYWRAQEYISTTSVKKISSQKQAHSVGSTLAKFHRIFESFDLELIQDPLPGFHKLSQYLSIYDENSVNTVRDYHGSLSYCHSMVSRYREKASVLEQEQHKGTIALRPVHGDPKVDNFIYDSCGNGVGMLDLDTVGAGLIYHDIGDCLRSACSMSGESPDDRRQPGFDLDCFEAILAGYTSSLGGEKLNHELVYSGLFAICFELGLRFFTDHLQGNVYFKVGGDGENLLKARKQFLLCEEIIKQQGEITSLAARLINQ